MVSGHTLLADRAYGRAIGTVLRPSVVLIVVKLPLHYKTALYFNALVYMNIFVYYCVLLFYCIAINKMGRN